MLAHGCVCNYPMFASLGLYRWPEIEKLRPATVTGAWVNQAARPPATDEVDEEDAPRRAPGLAAAEAGGAPFDVAGLRLINSTAQAVGAGLQVSAKDEGAGYAVAKLAQPAKEAVFRFVAQRAPGTKRHGNAFFVCGSDNDPKSWIECQIYYGGRSSIRIAGGQVETAEEKVAFDRRAPIAATVTVSCPNRTVTVEAGGAKLTAPITGTMDRIVCYGFGGANSDTLFTGIVAP